MLGVTRCPNCTFVGSFDNDLPDPPPCALRSRDATLHVILEARAQARLRGVEVLNKFALHDVHLDEDNPFIYMPHFNLQAFVPEKLHVWWVSVCAVQCACAHDNVTLLVKHLFVAT